MDPWLRLLSVLNVESHRLIFLRMYVCFFFSAAVFNNAKGL